MIDLSVFFRTRSDSIEVFVTGLSLTFTKLIREEIDTSLTDSWANRTRWIGDTIEKYVPNISSMPHIVLDCRMENFYMNQIGRSVINRFNLLPSQTKILTTVDPKDTLLNYEVEIDLLSQSNYCNFYDNLVAEKIDWKNIEIDIPVISLSGRATENRARLTRDLIDISKGRARISFGGTTHYSLSEQDIKKFKDILYPHPFPVQIETDNKVLESILTQHNPPGNQLYRSLLAIVNETNDFNIPNIYLSEKSFKFFAWHQIPLFVAAPGHVDTMRKLGFDMFDDIVDHSYDTAKNAHVHKTMVLNAISKFLKEYPNLDDINRLRREVWDRLEANENLLADFNNNKKYESWTVYG